MRIQVLDLTGKTITHQTIGELDWSPIAQACAEWFQCSPDDVHAGESEDGDTIEVNGEVVGRIKWIFPRSELVRAKAEKIMAMHDETMRMLAAE